MAEKPQEPQGNATERLRPVVGVGASAGGVEALGHLFRSMPNDVAMAFVVVTHLAPNRKSQLAEVIGHSTRLPVVVIEDGQRAEPGRIHVLPPNATLTIEDGVLRLKTDGVDRRERNPIDLFFASLAADRGENAVGIVLSGSGSDGTLGLKTIKERDGLTIAQGPSDSEPGYPEMPESAIASGIVDLVLPVGEIGERLVAYVRQPKLDTDDGKAPDRSAQDAQREIAALLLRHIGHDFSGYKNQTFMRRVERRRRVLQLPDVPAYVGHLRRSPDEVAVLFRDLLIGVTSFFRDPDAFARLDELVVPKLFEKKGPNDIVRVWVPACATGEEVYSIAMLLLEHMDRLEMPPKIQVFGTDIDTAALAVARAGSYPAALLDGVSAQRRERFFARHGAKFTVTRKLRDVCMFSDHSLVRDPPFSRMDLVSCRNLLIYLGAELQERIIPIFHYALKPNGYLFLGTSESATRHRDLFTPLDKKERIFERRYHPSAPRLMVRDLGVFAGPHKHEDEDEPAPAPAALQRPVNLRRAVEQHVLEQFAPAHVVVNHEGNVIYYSPRTGKYLEPAPGLPNHHLVALARKNLRLEVGNALKEAMERHQRVERHRIPVEIDDRVQFVNVTVEPTSAPNAGGKPLFLVLFTDVGAPVKTEDDFAPLRALGRDGDTREMEQELRGTRERLQATIEEYETSLEELKSSNEEMTSVNEEMQSTNEELESSKEELQSVNEELHTVNSELNAKIDELGLANADLNNLFEATGIAIVFLDRNLRIRNFTPVVTKFFNLIATDQGRPLTDIVSHLDGDVWNDIRSVLTTRQPVERQMQQRGKPDIRFQVRVLPYWGKDRQLDGVILTFVDVTKSIEAETQLRTVVEELNHRVKNMLAVVLALLQMSKKGATSLDDFAASLTGRVHALAKSYDLVTEVRWSDVRIRALFRDVFRPFTVDGTERIVADGPPLLLKPKATLALGLAFHELGTNATKYGALSRPEGRLALTWGRQGPEPDAPVVIRWRESGGPPVVKPRRTGFGTELIRREVEGELKGTLTLDYAASGLEATITVPLNPEVLRLDPEERS